jgi:hypothetical protein
VSRAERDADLGPAYYARPPSSAGGWGRDVWVLLHPPYTAWHLAYVAIGACLLGPVDWAVAGWTLAAFFLAVGVGAHALDELQGRPLRTGLSDRALIGAAVLGLGGATFIGVAGAVHLDAALWAFVAIGVLLVLGYNLELLGGRLHTDLGFAAAWGAFPVLTGFFAQHGRLSPAAILAAGFALCCSLAQRALSTPARALRRSTVAVTGSVRRASGEVVELDHAAMLAPLEAALRALSWSVVLLAAALAVSQAWPLPF